MSVIISSGPHVSCRHGNAIDVDRRVSAQFLIVLALSDPLLGDPGGRRSRVLGLVGSVDQTAIDSTVFPDHSARRETIFSRRPATGAVDSMNLSNTSLE